MLAWYFDQLRGRGVLKVLSVQSRLELVHPYLLTSPLLDSFAVEACFMCE